MCDSLTNCLQIFASITTNLQFCLVTLNVILSACAYDSNCVCVCVHKDDTISNSQPRSGFGHRIPWKMCGILMKSLWPLTMQNLCLLCLFTNLWKPFVVDTFQCTRINSLYGHACRLSLFGDNILTFKRITYMDVFKNIISKFTQIYPALVLKKFPSFDARQCKKVSLYLFAR